MCELFYEDGYEGEPYLGSWSVFCFAIDSLPPDLREDMHVSSLTKGDSISDVPAGT